MSRDNSDISDDAKGLLARVRNASDRQNVDFVRLVRTFYGDGSDETFKEIIADSEFDDPIFDNATLYDAGTEDGLQTFRSILTRIPQIIEVMPNLCNIHHDEWREDLAEAIQAGPDGPEWDYAVEMTHKQAKWSHVLIYDKEANDSGEVLLVYTDDRGRVLRYCRVGPGGGTEDLQHVKAMLYSRQDIEHIWWEIGRYGENWVPERLVERWAEVDN